MSDGVIDLSVRCRSTSSADAVASSSGAIVWPRSPPPIAEQPQPPTSLSSSCPDGWLVAEDHPLTDRNNQQREPVTGDRCYSGLVVEPISPYSPPTAIGQLVYEGSRLHTSRFSSAVADDVQVPRHVTDDSDELDRRPLHRAEGYGVWESRQTRLVIDESNADYRNGRRTWFPDRLDRCGDFDESEPEVKRMLLVSDAMREAKYANVSTTRAPVENQMACWTENVDHRQAASREHATAYDRSVSGSVLPSSGSWVKNDPAIAADAARNETTNYDAAAAKFDEYTRGLTTADGSGLFVVGGARSKPTQSLRTERPHPFQTVVAPYHYDIRHTASNVGHQCDPVHWTTRSFYGDRVTDVDDDASPVPDQCLATIESTQNSHLPEAPPMLRVAMLSSGHQQQFHSSSPLTHQQQPLHHFSPDDRHHQQSQQFHSTGDDRRPIRAPSTSPASSSTSTKVSQPACSLGASSGSSDFDWPPDSACDVGSRSNMLFDAEAMMKMMLKMTAASKTPTPMVAATSTTSNSVKSHQPEDHISFYDKDEAYRERRRKNNEAAKRSRDYRRQKERSVAKRADELKVENVELRAQIMLLTREVHNLQGLLMQQRIIANSIGGSKLQNGNTDSGDGGSTSNAASSNNNNGGYSGCAVGDGNSNAGISIMV